MGGATEDSGNYRFQEFINPSSHSHGIIHKELYERNVLCTEKSLWFLLALGGTVCVSTLPVTLLYKIFCHDKMEPRPFPTQSTQWIYQRTNVKSIFTLALLHPSTPPTDLKRGREVAQSPKQRSSLNLRDHFPMNLSSAVFGNFPFISQQNVCTALRNIANYLPST